MEKTESVNVSMGYKIKVSEIIEKLDESTFKICKFLINNGYIEDEKSCLNNTYLFIIQNNKNNDVESYKAYLEKYFSRECGTNICLSDQYLLIPIKEILNMNRKGYDRCGINTKSINLDDFKNLVDSNINNEIMKDFEYEVVMITKLSSS